MGPRAPILEEKAETLEDVQNKLWLALPSIIQLREAAAVADTTTNTSRQGNDVDEIPQESLVAENPSDQLREAMVSLEDLRQLAECLFMACHRNPIAKDVESGVEALLEILDKEKALYSQDDFVQLLREVESRWLEWPDMEKKWLGLSEKQHVEVLKELVQCVTPDTEPLALLSRQQVLTMQSVVVHTKELVTPFETFFDFVTPRELPAIYDMLWDLLTQGVSDAADMAILTLEQFTIYFKWFYLHLFSNATEEAAGVAARTVWLDHLNAQGVMTKKQFVEASRRVSRQYRVVGGDVQCLERLYKISERILKESGGAVEGIALFQQRGETLEADRMLVDPNDLYAPEELDEGKQEMELYASDISKNRIVVYGKRGVGKTVLGKALARRLKSVHLSIEELAAEAVAKAGRGDLLGVEIAHCVDKNVSIPLSLLSPLVRRKLSENEILYRGYVFSDLPVVYDLECVDKLQFLNDCGILDVFVPNTLVHLSCDDRFHVERLETTLAERKPLHDEELRLRGAVEEEMARRAAMAERIEQLQTVIAQCKEILAEDPSTVTEPEELESARDAAAKAERELQEVLEDQKRDAEEATRMASEHAARAKRINKLTLKRLVDEALVGKDGRGDAIPVTSLPCFQAIVERLRLLDRCLTIGCTSLVENSITYILDTLLLRPCILPQGLLERQPRETEGSGWVVNDDDEEEEEEAAEAEIDTTIEKDLERAKEMERAAVDMGAIHCSRWKRFCPVTFAECDVLVEGTAKYSCMFRQRHYYLASAAKLAKFKANPPMYLRAMPLNREPILLLSTIGAQDMEQLAPDALQDLIQTLHEQLRLTPVEFNDFAERWDMLRNLKEMRDNVLSERMAYEATERKLRADRLKKRMTAERKKRKSVPKPPKPSLSKKRKSTLNQPDQEEVFKGWEKEAEKPETSASRIENLVAERINHRKTFVPILLHALGDMSNSAFDQLLHDGVLPETVLVLQCERPQRDGDDEGTVSPSQDKVEDEEKDKDETSVAMPQLTALDTLLNAGKGMGVGDASTSQNFIIHRFVVNGKDTSVLTTEILQAVCPGMPPVEDGVVDETLEEMEEEEEEEEEGEEKVPDVVDATLRPGKRFLNQFGSRLRYCPVSLYEKRLLVRGLNEFCVQYQQKLYVFASEEAKEKFERNPQRYLQTPPPYVPPRLWLVGYSKSGKKTLAKALQEKYKVPFFQYNRKFSEQCVEAARVPGGRVVSGITIPEQTGDNPYLTLAESILKDLRNFAAEQERCLKERQEAELVMEQRAQAEARENEEDNDGDEEEEGEEENEDAEALLQARLEFEAEDEEDRELRLSEAYLKITSCVTRIEPFESQGYMMVCPPFSDADMDLLFSTGGIPEVVLQLELSGGIHSLRNTAALLYPSSSVPTEAKAMEDEKDVYKSAMSNWLAEKQRREERKLRKWRRRHIGMDDPQSDSGDESGEEPAILTNTNAVQNGNPNYDDAVKQALMLDRNEEEEALNEFVDAISDRFIPIVVLNGDLSENAVFRAATRKLFKVLEHRRSLLHMAEIVSFENAMRMLVSGEALLSSFGKTDLVSLYDTRHGVRRICRWMSDGKRLEPEPAEGREQGSERWMGNGELASGGEHMAIAMEGEEAEGDEGVVVVEAKQKLPLPGEEEEEETPSAVGDSDNGGDNGYEEMSEEDVDEMEEICEAVARLKRRDWLRRCQRVALFANRLYFFDSDASLSRYLQDPLLFVQQPPPLPPPPPGKAVISVYGAEDHSFWNQEGNLRKRGIAEHVAFNVKLLFISLPKLLSWAAVQSPMLSLSQRAIDAAIHGFADDALVAELLAHRLNAADVRLRGAVLLNLPRSPNQYRLLMEWGLRVDKVFQFDESYMDVVSFIKSTATVEAPFSFSQASIAALTEMTKYVDDFGVNEGRLALGRIRGFPIMLDNTYHTRAEVESHLSAYRWFCPYSWAIHSDLVDQYNKRQYGALYLGQYYYFSSDAFLQRFLLYPAEVTAHPGFRSLPDVLPSRVPPSKEYQLEFLGCCPVLLYNTRENRGLRGVLEPVARKGDPHCVVEYDNRYYALLDEASLELFLMRPWQYVEGTKLPSPRKVPLPEGQKLSTISEYDFLRRSLYDPVAHALIAVAEARPKYPGLSAEESALKFIALHMKCFNDKNSAIQAEQYRDNFELFRKRSTLYRSMTQVTDGDVHSEEFLHLCAEWELAINGGLEKVSALVHLRPVT